MDRFLDLSSRLSNPADAEAKYALVNGLKPEVEIHLLGQAHVTTLREALAELRVYAQARRGAIPTTGSRADFGTAIGPTPMELVANYSLIHRASALHVPSPEAHRRGATSTPMDPAVRVCNPTGSIRTASAATQEYGSF